ncbi:hypothetical protein TNCV_4512801 [Trichonephila clavipes]|nr:hypothetical protein TNCV_4512801 [Trichonephila clavipes]
MIFDTVDGVRTVKSLGSKDMDAKCRECGNNLIKQKGNETFSKDLESEVRSKGSKTHLNATNDNLVKYKKKCSDVEEIRIRWCPEILVMIMMMKPIIRYEIIKKTMVIKLKTTILSIDRYGVSYKATAAIASSTIEVNGLINDSDTHFKSFLCSPK